MADVEDERSVAASEGSGGLNIDEDTGIDADFGSIEMFDSNAAPTMFSSGAPEAIMTEDAPVQSSTRKPKRDKKDKKDKKRRASQEDVIPSSFVPEEGETTSRRSRRPKRKSTRGMEAPDSQPSNEQVEAATDTLWDQFHEEAEAVTSSNAKNKRKHSGSAEGKQRKKHRSKSQESEDPTGGEGDGGSQEAGAASFLLTKKDSRGVPESAVYEDDEPESDPQASPTVALLRRRSQSRETRSRENSVPRSSQMDVDVASTRVVGQVATAAAVGADGADDEAERLAREAWNEHRNGQHTQEEEVVQEDQDADMLEKYPQEPLTTGAAELTAEAQLASGQPKKSRSARKRAKPTYFERPNPEIPADEDAKNGLAESPSTMTQSSRNRKKRAAKKASRSRKPTREKLSHSARARSVDAEEDEGATAERPNRLNGYTQGRFTDAELARISRAVETFREDNGLTQPEVNDLIHAPGGTTAGEKHAQLWTRIFAECPDRHRQKVINISRKKFHNFVARGTWTPEQDAELAEFINMHGTKWSLIAGIINRHPEDLRDRYRNYIVCGANQRKDAWDEHEEARLTQYIMESMHAIDELRASEPSKAILQKSYEELIDWQDISERMDRTRSRLQCITKWKSLNIRTHGKDKLLSTQPDSRISFRLEKARRQIAVMPSEERYRLVMAVQATAVGTDVKIPWQRLVDKPFRNRWHRITQMLLWRRLKATVPNHTEASVRDTTQYLLDHYNQAGDLPDVPDELFDDADEMQFIKTVAPLVPLGPAQTNEQAPVSAEFVAESDGEEAGEEAGAEQNGGTEAGGDGTGQDQPLAPLLEDEEMKIDPALAEAGPTAKKPTPTKRGGGKRPGSRKRGRKQAKGDVNAPVQDAAQEVDQAQDASSGIDAERLGRQGTPSKIQSPQGSDTARQSPPDDDVSDMDDMEDLPATIPGEA